MQKSEVKDRVYRILHDELDIEGVTITPNMHLMNDLGADSLGSVEIVMLSLIHI